MVGGLGVDLALSATPRLCGGDWHSIGSAPMTLFYKQSLVLGIVTVLMEMKRTR
jgi:hypothetical protein